MLPTFRFAPSPNGRLHLGHAYSALLNASLAKRLGGRLLVRLEDIDTTRCTAELAEACLNDLRWLGLTWEEPVRVQSQHWNDYQAAFETLKARGLVYPCFCSRKEIAHSSHAHDPDGAPIYAGTCRHVPHTEAQARMDAGEPHAWRLDMQRALAEVKPPYRYRQFEVTDFQTTTHNGQPQQWGDVVLVRKEIPTSYHLSVVVDDALQNITHVVRGQDLEAATDIHVLLQRLLDLPTPHYHHHRLISEAAGDKLSKSNESESLEDLKAKGFTASDFHTFFLDISN